MIAVSLGSHKETDGTFQLLTEESFDKKLFIKIWEGYSKTPSLVQLGSMTTWGLNK